MKKLLFIAALLFTFLNGECFSQLNPKFGLKEIYADLNSDGFKEKITWQKFASTELGDYYQIVVFDSKGNTLWKAPKTTDESSPFFVASLDTGVSIPELIADIDNDGKLEMLIPAPASDVSPLWYKRLKWKNGKFIPMKSAILQYNPNAKNMPLKWIYKYPGSYSFWVMGFWKKNNKIKASIAGFYPDSSSDYGEVYLHFAKRGAFIDSWIKPLKRHKKRVSKISYIAKLSRKDHYNSKGSKLLRVADIIRQDRANFYKGKKDLKDQSDPVFSNPLKRKSLSKYKVYLHGISKKSILKKTPTVKIVVDFKKGKIDIFKTGIRH